MEEMSTNNDTTTVNTIKLISFKNATLERFINQYITLHYIKVI